MKTINEEVYKVCLSFCHFRSNGKPHSNYLKTVYEDLIERGIETEKEAFEHLNDWLKNRRGTFPYKRRMKP